MIHRAIAWVIGTIEDVLSLSTSWTWEQRNT